MTNKEKKQIDGLRNQGMSYTEIAMKLAISRATVVSYLNRKEKENVVKLFCKECGREFKPLDKNRVKIFCSDSCRFTWWKNHKKEKGSSMVTKVCLCCGESFVTYPSKDNKYCSRECYLRMVGVHLGQD